MSDTAQVVPDETSGYGSALPVKLSRIVPMPDQPRQYFDLDALEDLANDIRGNGQQTPVRLVRNPEKAGEFILFAGERRWRAFHILWKRDNNDAKQEPVVKALVEVVKSKKELFKLAFLDNLRRENLIPLDEAAGYHRLRAEGSSIESIRVTAGKAYSHVDNYLRVHTLPDSVKALMNPDRKEGQLTISNAIEIARSIGEDDPDLRLEIALEAIERELDRAETRNLALFKGGRAERSYGGRLRKPSDDHRVLIAFIRRTRATATSMKRDFHLPSVYASRPESDMRSDAAELRAAIDVLNQLLAEFT